MSSGQRQALGRGLSALIPKTGAAAGIDTVDIDLIVPNPQQPRLKFDADALRELSESIREHGVLQPIIVTQVTSESSAPTAGGGMVEARTTTYQLIAGERRLQASRMAGITRMPVVVREATGAALLEIALVENVQRQDLNPLEEALAFKRLNEDFGQTQEQIAQRVGRSRVAIANTLRLLLLEDDIRASVASGQISAGHARALLGIEESRLRLDAWRRIVADAMTVRQAEEIAKALKSTSGGATPARGATKIVRTNDPHVQAIESDLRTALGVPVSLKKARRGGSITIRFHSDDELEGIIARISGG